MIPLDTTEREPSSAPPVAPPVPSSAPPRADRYIGPQEGFQTNVLSSPADILVSGGGAGAGKTYGLLLEPLRNIDVPGFGAVIFRRETPMITNQGGLWDESTGLYNLCGAKPNENEHSWTFPPHSCRVRFTHMQYASDRFAWDGSQIPLIGYDQLEHFEEIQFWYMLSRNRSVCGVEPYIRATCNPVPEDDPTGGWLNKLVSWWIDPETGYAIPERSGVIRWLVRLNDVVHWGDTRQGLIAKIRTDFPLVPLEDLQPKSFTFIPGKLTDNEILLKADPSYRASLLAMPYVERERLLGGNWKIKPSAGKVFNRAWFASILKVLPSDVVAWVRYWDKAGTEGGGKYTSGALMGRRSNGRFILADIVRGQWSAGNRETIIRQTAIADAQLHPTEIWVEQEPGSGGKESASNTIRNLAGFTIHAERVTGAKTTRAGPFSAQAEAGNIDLLENLGQPVDGISALEAFLSEAQNFDGVHGYSDQIDSASGAFNKLALPFPTAGVW